MSSHLERVADLIRLAMDDAATEFEARTAAYQACRLIHAHDLLGTGNPPMSQDRSIFIKNKYQAGCKICGQRVAVGEYVYWTPGKGVEHAQCHTEIE